MQLKEIASVLVGRGHVYRERRGKEIAVTENKGTALEGNNLRANCCSKEQLHLRQNSHAREANASL